MGIFFRSQAVLPTVSAAIEDALRINLANVPNPQQEAANRAAAVVQQVSGPGQFYWIRLIFAALILFAILGAGIYTDLHNLEVWSKMLLHSFEILLGIVVGLLGGEAAARG